MEQFTLKDCAIIELSSNNTIEYFESGTILNNTCSTQIEKNVTLLYSMLSEFWLLFFQIIYYLIFLFKECYKFGQCIMTRDAFYYLTFILLCLGIIWFYFYNKILITLQSLPSSAWKIKVQTEFVDHNIVVVRL